MSDSTAPPESPPDPDGFLAAVDRFDRAADVWFERVRDDPILDRVMTFATHAGEFSAVWHVTGATRGLLRGRPDQIVALAIGLGLESLIVNQGLKRLVGRRRPTDEGDERFEIRKPLTSSFPSGHASSAAFAATVLVGWDGKRWAPLYGSMAALVALSRPYVRIHHASDIVGGVVVGASMGWIARRLFARLGLD
ncbi:phosphatase PAP2 family protein [Ilumatobacter sp.]|uniref:phosphatase PAP2 family protein n=1 Tax=Ilumatobacter sp. TaxID=1967498 RepID=UPI003AF73968